MLPDAAGKPASMFGCHVDITRHRRAEAERLELEAELSRNQHMSEIGSLVAGVAHEARNPLFAITASLDAFDARFGSRPEMAAYLQALRSSTSRLLRLMDGLLDYGRPRHPAIRALAVKSLFEEACRLSAPVAGAANVELQWANDSGCRVSVDQDQALQLLQNLIANAIQFSPAGGLVTLSARPVQSNGRDMVELEVRDHGPGFAPGDLPHLFEPFFTRREGGTGLGLPIVMRIAKAHGGDVIVRNAPDGGALVSVRLPAAADSAAAPSGPVTGSGARA
jgi:signal transduction histidine kinase